MNNIIHGDALEKLKEIGNDSIDLVCADPPYNIGKVWWDKVPDYINWLGNIILELQRVIKENGSFYIFHNQMPIIARLMIWIEDNTDFVFKQFIVWNKRFKDAKNYGYLQGFIETNALRNYQKMVEYILFYTFQDDTGLTKVKLDLNNFTTLREYFRDFQQVLRLNKKQIIEIIGQRADHCFRWNSSQWDLPTLETYAELCKLPRKNNNFLCREYESLRREYESLRYTFNNQKTHHSVWNYSIVEKDGHVTRKPIELIKNIILHSSNNGDIVLDPFCGSGTTLCAAKMLGRKYVGIERDIDYIEMCKKSLDKIQEL